MISNVKKLIKGSILSKLIIVLMVPVIARIYSPDEIGVAALFTSAVLIISPLINLRYCIAIPLPKRDKVVDLIIVICVFLSAFFSLFFLLLTWVVGIEIYNFLGIGEIYDYRYILIITCFAVSLNESMSMWIVRIKKFEKYSMVLVKQSILGSVVKVVTGLLGLGSLGIILGSVVQNSAGLIQFLNLYLKKRKRIFSFTVKKVWFTFKYYLNYLYFKFPAHILYVVSAQLPIIYASKYFNVSDVGQLSLAISLISIPVGAVSRSVSKVYFSEMSTIGRQYPQKLYYETKSVLLKLILVGGAISLVTFILSPFAFNVVLGDNWIDAGVLSRALSIGLALQITATTLITVLNVINLNFLSFFIHLIRFALISLSFCFASVFSLNLIESIYIYSFVLLIFYLIVIVTIMSILKSKSDKKNKSGDLLNENV